MTNPESPSKSPVASSGWTKRSELILAITLSLGLGVSMVPEWVAQLDQTSDRTVAAIMLSSIKVVLASGLAVGAIAATLLNLLLPHDARSAREP